VARARAAIQSGEIGQVTHARVWLLTDYAAHPGGPLSWRYTLEKGGHGVLGDLASHGVDLARYVVGDLVDVVALTDTFIPRRPLAQAGASHYAVGSADGPSGPVENEDYVVALARTTSGIPLTLESSRAAVGEQNNYGLEVHGTRGLVRWDFRRSDELALSAGDSYANQPTSTVYAGPGDGDYDAFQPGAGIAISYDDSKVIECAAFLRSIATGQPHGAGIDDAVHSAAALDAIVTSAATRAWVTIT
jgi:predicted dehydrogenase